ncbi:SMI1/KNR4 family protein, partial [Salmonella enterica subsp. enterica]|nr:SMI1/KNR4 family protein [Salmonella enterica subsp. enterica serovar Javiana]
MPTNALIDFEALAAETGIVLPDLLRSLLATGKTVYGPEWASTWREQALQGS